MVAFFAVVVAFAAQDGKYFSSSVVVTQRRNGPYSTSEFRDSVFPVLPVLEELDEDFSTCGRYDAHAVHVEDA